MNDKIIALIFDSLTDKPFLIELVTTIKTNHQRIGFHYSNITIFVITYWSLTIFLITHFITICISK